MNEPDTLTEQTLEEFLFDVSSVSKYLPIENLCKYRPHSAIPVIYVCPCKTECYHFPRIIAEQMQLESMTPAHGTLAVLGKTGKDLARNSVLHCDIQESSCCQRTLCPYTCRRHGASWTTSSWGTHGVWVPQNGYRKRQQGIHAWATHGYSSDNTPWNYDMYRNDSTQGLSWFHSQKAFPYDSCNVFHCCYRTVNIGFYSVQHSNSCQTHQ